MPLTELGRYVLGSLPAWHPDEAWVIEQEGGAEHSVRSHSLEELHSNLDSNPAVANMTPEEVERCVRAFVEAGLAESAEKELDVPTLDGEDTEPVTVEHFRMTEAGFQALHAPESNTEQVPGEVFLELHPARGELNTELGG